MRLAVLLALVASPLVAEPVAVAVGSKTISFDVPDGFVQSFEQGTDRSFIRGYVPDSPADAARSDLITLTVTRNLAGLPDLSTVDFLNFGLSSLKAQCKGEFAQEVISTDYTIAERPALGVFMSCANDTATPAGQSQDVAFIAFRGPTDFYALQWIARGPALEKPAAYDATLWQARVDALVNSARLCDAASEPVPCPE